MKDLNEYNKKPKPTKENGSFRTTKADLRDLIAHCDNAMSSVE